MYNGYFRVCVYECVREWGSECTVTVCGTMANLINPNHVCAAATHCKPSTSSSTFTNRWNRWLEVSASIYAPPSRICSSIELFWEPLRPIYCEYWWWVLISPTDSHPANTEMRWWYLCPVTHDAHDARRAVRRGGHRTEGSGSKHGQQRFEIFVPEKTNT